MMTMQLTRSPERLAEASAIHDDTLATLMCTGDERALGMLYDRYGRLVFSIALRITGSPETAEEVTQDTFQQAWQGIGGYRLGHQMGAWLCGIARHRAIDATRSKRERARARESVTIDGLHELADQTHSVALDAEYLDLRGVIRQALHELPAAQRQTLELAYFGGLTCDEIAHRTNTPRGTVRSRLRLGMSRLRGALAPYMAD
jgi:RNA polymerase sigma-70 factor, ECF subfamily